MITTKRQRALIAALERLGYARVPPGQQRSTRYVELRLGPGGRSLLKPGNKDHRVLAGPRALRFTRSTIARSVPFQKRTITRLLDGSLAPAASQPPTEEEVGARRLLDGVFGPPMRAEEKT